MKPADLRALLEKASPRPWDRKNCVDLWGNECDREFVLALVNRAELLIEMWEAVRDGRRGRAALAKLEES